LRGKVRVSAGTVRVENLVFLYVFCDHSSCFADRVSLFVVQTLQVIEDLVQVLRANRTFREASKDTLLGGPGNDLLGAFDSPAFKDVVRYDRGFDRVSADRKDLVSDDCGVVTVGRAEAEELLEDLEGTGILEGIFESLAPDPFGGD
jgi:hypothetical protein